MLYNNIFFFIESFLLNLYIHFGFVLMLKVDLLIHHILFLKQNRIYLLILYSLKKSTMDYNFLKDLLNGKLQILIQGIFESECHNIQYNGRVKKCGFIHICFWPIHQPANVDKNKKHVVFGGLFCVDKSTFFKFFLTLP